MRFGGLIVLVGTFLFRYHFAGITPTVFFFVGCGVGGRLLKKKVNKMNVVKSVLRERKTKTRTLIIRE